MGLLVSLVAFGNLTDYDTNFAFVQHVLTMDTTFPSSTIRYRAITNPALHHAAYALIIATEILTAALCWMGRSSSRGTSATRVRGSTALSASPSPGSRSGSCSGRLGSSPLAASGLGCGRRRSGTGSPSAFRYLVMTLGVLMFLSLPDHDTSEP